VISVRVITDIRKLKLESKSVVAIGVFDGVHQAHRLIISQAVKFARRRGQKTIVFTFWPHPQGKASLISLAHRLSLISQLAVDICVVSRFDRSFAAISAEDFVKNILVKRLNASAVFIGENFRFGKNAQADASSLQEFSRLYGFQVRVLKVFKTGRAVISSTLIRKLISSGKLKEAEKILMRPVSVLGVVIKGASLGAKLGFPTANIDPHHEVLPPSGIYAARINVGKKIYSGVCYIGIRPTFSKKNQSVEAHIFDFNKNIYGQDIEIKFIRKIRPDKKFSGPQDLVKQIKKDIIKAKAILSRH
jgi:riboflavin kinase / FMN adenylyltransferase